MKIKIEYGVYKTLRANYLPAPAWEFLLSLHGVEFVCDSIGWVSYVEFGERSRAQYPNRAAAVRAFLKAGVEFIDGGVFIDRDPAFELDILSNRSVAKVSLTWYLDKLKAGVRPSDLWIEQLYSMGVTIIRRGVVGRESTY